MTTVTVPLTEAVPEPDTPAASEVMNSLASALTVTLPLASIRLLAVMPAKVLPEKYVITATGATAAVPEPARDAAMLNKSASLRAVTSTVPPETTYPPRRASTMFWKTNALPLTATAAVPAPAKLNASR